ncbi:hypothetical protein [Mucilaginibacter sp. CSA2-8R]|uniref:hypothetical protein n=1 Tax=Mucilaginibacter sp. CSA2-8R TaxID=3141542 RepID=UPI00315CDF6F
MLNLYFLFLIYGLFIFYCTLLVWSYADGALSIYPFLCLAGAAVLFVIASALALYQIKPAAWLGVICLAVTSPMFFGLLMDTGLQSGLLTAVMGVASVIFYLGMFTSVKVIRTGSPAITLTSPLRVALTLVPAGLFIWWLLAVFALK